MYLVPVFEVKARTIFAFAFPFFTAPYATTLGKKASARSDDMLRLREKAS